NADAYQVAVEMPGVDEQGVEVNLEGGVLTVAGTARLDTYEGFQLQYGEYELGRYHRQLRVGEGIDAEQISAHVKDGILHLVLPKRAHSKPRNIVVQSG